ncbi:MAG: methylmalonyl Co-A mutase-associated GTPase MeaB [candidate division Zixibacteria bacterium]|nr:methylmalonyl Co-A mutase-associated GTPase MeaB [candidate division Zixibacteria bacterium]
MNLPQEFKQGKIRALAKLISAVENREEDYQKVLADIYHQRENSIRIGFTGSPGVGKSTLVDCIARSLLERNERIGVIAVDPTSPFTGGAFLGDRVRFKGLDGSANLFLRSMATRGSSGGLSGQTDDVALVMEAFGFDKVLIETVGVGQVELDIVDTCDLVVVILVPESGDAVQTMKAGLLEIADVFVVNKADRPGADRVVSDLISMLAVKKKHHGEENDDIAIISTEGTNEKNIDKLLEAIDSRLISKIKSGEMEKSKRARLRKKILRIAQERFVSETSKSLFETVQVDNLIDGIISGKDDPFSAAKRIYEASPVSN